MWPPWRKSSGQKHILSKNFSCSSFKDVQTIFKGDVEQITPKKSNIFQRVRLANTVIRNWSCSPPKNTPSPSPSPPPQLEPRTTRAVPSPGAEKGIVVYYTSLRVVRRTFADCRTVLSILRGFRVSIDERDLLMDAGFLKELKTILGSKELKLPRVFIGGRYIGGAEEIRQLHETGELKRFVEGFPAAEVGVCGECGGHRFLLCQQCNGSRKFYVDKCGEFRSCSTCNENGLIKCPSCYSCSPNLKDSLNFENSLIS